MFDLNERMNEWRAGLAQSQSLGKTDIDELESHLREEIDSLKESKLSDEEAFLIAARRLGDSASIANEYAKIDRSGVLRRILYTAAGGVLVYLLLTYFAAAVETACILLGSVMGVSGYGLGLIGLASKAIILALVFLLCYDVCRQKSSSGQFIKRTNLHIRRRRFSIALLIFLIAVIVSRIVFPVMAARVMGIQDYAKVALVKGYVQLTWHLILPVLLVMFLTKLRRSDLNKLEA